MSIILIIEDEQRVAQLLKTGLGSTDDKLDGFNAGADDYMVKPFDFRELNARIKALLKRGAEPATPAPTTSATPTCTSTY